MYYKCTLMVLVPYVSVFIILSIRHKNDCIAEDPQFLFMPLSVKCISLGIPALPCLHPSPIPLISGCTIEPWEIHFQNWLNYRESWMMVLVSGNWGWSPLKCFFQLAAMLLPCPAKREHHAPFTKKQGPFLATSSEMNKRGPTIRSNTWGKGPGCQPTLAKAQGGVFPQIITQYPQLFILGLGFVDVHSHLLSYRIPSSLGCCCVSLCNL